MELTGSTLGDGCGIVSLTGGGSTLATGCITGTAGQIDRTVLPADGPYTVVIDPSGAHTGQLHVRLIAASDQLGPITADGAAVVAAVSTPGSVVRLTFSATVGQLFSITATDSTLGGGCGVLTLRGPDDQPVTAGCLVDAGGFVDRTTVTAAGTWTAVLDPIGGDVGQARLRLNQVIDQTGPMVVDGPPVAATIAQPGATARFTVEATAGQRLTTDITASAGLDGCRVIDIVDPAGTTLATGCVSAGAGGIAPVTAGVTGSYTIVLDPVGAATGTATIRVHT